MKKYRSIILSAHIFAAFACAAGAQQNGPGVAGTQENAPAAEGVPVADGKPLTNERIASMARSGVSNSTIISLILQFPCEFDASPEALAGLRDAGVSSAVINAVEVRASIRPTEKPERGKTLTDENIASIVSDALNYAPASERSPVPDKWALGIVYPGAALRYRTSGNTAWEVKAQSGSGVFIAGPRFYYYLVPGSGLSLFCGAEGDYLRFKGDVSKGYGFAGGAFLGGDISFAGPFTLSMDFGPMFMSLTDNKSLESVSGMDYIINMGVYWHFK